MRYVMLFLIPFILQCQTTGGSKDQMGKESQGMIFASKETEKILTHIENTGGSAKALKDLMVAHKGHPEDLVILDRMARIHLLNRNQDQVKKLIKQMVSIDFHSKEAKLLEANLAYMNKIFPQAEMILNQLGGAESENPEVLNLLAGIALHQGDDGKSMELLTRSLDLDKSYLAAYLNLGLLYLKHNDFSRAKDNFMRVLSEKPNSWEARLNLGVCLVAMGKNLEGLAIYKQLYRENSKEDELIYYLSQYYIRKGDLARAVSYLEDYIDLATDAYSAKVPAKRLLEQISLLANKSQVISEKKLTELNVSINKMPEPTVEKRKRQMLDQSYVFSSIGLANL